jgi:hypothetical protein
MEVIFSQILEIINKFGLSLSFVLAWNWNLKKEKSENYFVDKKLFLGLLIDTVEFTFTFIKSKKGALIFNSFISWRFH